MPSETLYRVVHRTTYRYGLRMSKGATVAHLVPRATPTQRVLASEVLVEPVPEERAEWTDVFGNTVSSVAVLHPHDSLEICATSTVAVSTTEGAVSPRSGISWTDAAEVLDADHSDEAIEARGFRVSSRLVRTSAAAREYAEPSFPPGRDLLEATADLCHRIFTEFEFDPSFSETTTPVSEVLEHRRGVCQDFAHLAVACLRSLRLPARYVSGYIETMPPPGLPRLVGADASHAWASVHVPGTGWVDLDPTNDQIPVGRHVTVAWGRDYADVAPVRGVVFGPEADQVLEVSVDVVTPDPS
jgi:transglutaminase-like putative cysteine protease